MEKCKYCTGDYDDDYLSIYKDKKNQWKLSLAHIEEVDNDLYCDLDYIYETINITYCPNCGRNLNFIENIFFSDLDNTLVYSKEKGHKCVEENKGKEVTYMTNKAFDLMSELLDLDNLVFAPCTMRTINQVLRINFFKDIVPQIAICTNGAQIYINGDLDLEWEVYMRNLVNINDIKSLEVHIDSLNIPIVDIRNIEGYYLQLKFEDEENANKYLGLISENISDKYDVYLLKQKMFIMNKNINKANAILYLKEKYTFGNVYTSGDSEADRSFNGLDFSKAYLPKHATFSYPKAYMTDKNGIESAESILREVINDIKK